MVVPLVILYLLLVKSVQKTIHLLLVVYCSNSADERQWQSRCQTLLSCRPRSDRPSGKVSSPDNTRRTYSTSEQRYLEFCRQYDWQPLPVIDINRNYSAAFLVQRLQPASVRVYMSAVRNLHLDMGLPYSEQPSSFFSRVLAEAQRIRPDCQ